MTKKVFHCTKRKKNEKQSWRKKDHSNKQASTIKTEFAWKIYLIAFNCRKKKKKNLLLTRLQFFFVYFGWFFQPELWNYLLLWAEKKRNEKGKKKMKHKKNMAAFIFLYFFIIYQRYYISVKNKYHPLFIPSYSNPLWTFLVILSLSLFVFLSFYYLYLSSFFSLRSSTETSAMNIKQVLTPYFWIFFSQNIIFFFSL